MGITAHSSCKRWRVSSRNIRAAGISPIQTWSASTFSIYVNAQRRSRIEDRVITREGILYLRSSIFDPLSSIRRRRRGRGRAVTFAGANDHPRFFDADFDSSVRAVLLRVARVVTERVLVAQLFGYVRKSL